MLPSTPEAQNSVGSKQPASKIEPPDVDLERPRALQAGRRSRRLTPQNFVLPKLGVSKSSIAKITGVTRPTLYNFIATRGLKGGA